MLLIVKTVYEATILLSFGECLEIFLGTVHLNMFVTLLEEHGARLYGLFS